ncbi:hypothetical protein [Rhodococcus sp. 27YEA15]|uniref:hypothetical protein n=1 Tax=Rhodococcus sp. 27YEA15 TaxID=3156259 RepID=UPI003C7D5E9B
MNTFQIVAAGANSLVFALLKVPVLGNLVGKSMVVITYRGRKSGKQFSLPVSFTRTGDELAIRVALPDKKNWWRNFLGEGGPVTVTLDGAEHPGHAVSTRTDSGKVTVKVTVGSAAS